MEFFSLQISQKANQSLDKFLPYEARAEICQKFGYLFGRFEDTKISFWDELTFSFSAAKTTMVSNIFLFLKFLA